MESLMVSGRIGQDAKVIEHQNSDRKSVVFSLATDRKFKKGDNWEKRTMWYKVFSRHVGLAPWLTKGSVVSVNGEPTPTHYQGRNGEIVANININARTVEILHSTSNASAQDAAIADAVVVDEDDDLPF